MRKFAEAGEHIAGTTKKLEKITIVADYLKSISIEDASVAAIFLSGMPFPAWRQAAVARSRGTLRKKQPGTYRRLSQARRPGRRSR
jgi:hypothetical protein